MIAIKEGPFNKTLLHIEPFVEAEEDLGHDMSEDCSSPPMKKLDDKLTPVKFSEDCGQGQYGKFRRGLSSVFAANKDMVLSVEGSEKEDEELMGENVPHENSAYRMDTISLELNNSCGDPNNNSMPSNSNPPVISKLRPDIPTAQIKVSNLPGDFNTDDLKYEIHKALWKHSDVFKRPQQVISMCERGGDGLAIVTFDSIKAASAVAALPLVEYEVSVVLIEQVFVAPAKEIPSNKVKVTGLPNDFEERDLKYEIHQALWKHSDVFKRPQQPIVSCERGGDGEAIVTFDSIEAASAAAALPLVEYEVSVVLIEQMFVAPPKEIPSNKVKVTGLPNDFQERDLKYEIHKALWKHSEVFKRPQQPIVSCERGGDGEAIVTFDSIEAASAVAALALVEFEDAVAHLEQIIDVESDLDNATRMADQILFEPHAETFLESPSNMNDEEVIDSSSTLIKKSLRDDIATLAFLKECIVGKGHDKIFRGTDEAMAKVCGALLQKHNIDVTVEECKNKKKRLDEQHRRGGPHVKWGPYMSFLRGESDKPPTDCEPLMKLSTGVVSYKPSTGSGCDRSEPESGTSSSLEEDVLSVVTFTKGAIMSPEAELTLIDIWRDLKDEYWKPHKDVPFYRKIATQMVLRGHIFRPEQCQNKMNSMVSDFKSYTTALKSTGRGRPAYWSLYEPLRPIMEDRVNVTAQQTFSVGGAAVAETRNDLVVAPTPNRGSSRERPSPPSNQTNQKKLLLEQLISSRNEMLAQLKSLATAMNKE